MTPDPKTASSSSRAPSFHGSAGTLFGIYFGNIILSFFTLGIYHFWGKVKVLKYLYNQTEFDGDRFEYHGQGLELFLGWLKFMALLLPVVLLFIYASFHPEWIAENVLFGIAYLVVLPLIPLALYGSVRYRLSRSSWRGIRFSFRGSLKECYKVFLTSLLVPLTLGLYLPYLSIRMQRYWVANRYFGNTPFTYDGDAREFCREFIRFFWKAVVLTIVLVGLAILMTMAIPEAAFLTTLLFPAGYIYLFIYSLRWKAWATRYHWSHTQIAGARFQSTLTAMDLFVMLLLDSIVLGLSAGIAFAWVRVQNIKIRFSRLTLPGTVDFEKIRAEALSPAKGVLGETAADVLGIDLDIG